MHNRECPHLPDHFQVAQVLFFLRAELVACPLHGETRQRINPLKIIVVARLLVMIALHDGTIHLPNNVQALAGVGIVTHDIAQTAIMGDTRSLGVGKNDFQSFEVGMNVTKNGVTHQERIVAIPVYRANNLFSEGI
ncbi:hypothetical protein QQ055_10450 [Geitlerinema calcuttense NRMC-F 0142]|uniref:Uncharacterized protein n=1 Tax=Geitlerinema calcuttense NRMC-F 0142 TaxID=2922238 RepID=A0ABT7M0T6_9CYAN|nr:hypothetical protein [Geitlerinema calcuttense NRMC-F 0142]